MMWETFNSTLRRLVVSGCCIHMFQHQRRCVKGCGPSTEGQWKVCDSELIYLITLYQLTQAIPGSDLGLIELMWRVLYGKFSASTSVWISCGDWWILYRSWFPIVHIYRDCAGWNRKDPLEYLEVQILDSLSVRMKHQPEDVDHLRCSPTKIYVR